MVMDIHVVQEKINKKTCRPKRRMYNNEVVLKLLFYNATADQHHERIN